MTAGTMMPPMRSTRDGEPCGAAHNVPINGNQGEGRFRPANVSPDRAKAGDGSQWTLEETSHLDPHLDRYGRHGTNPEYPHQLCQPRRSLLAESHVYPSNSDHAGRASCSPSFIFNPSSFFILVFFLRLSLSLPRSLAVLVPIAPLPLLSPTHPTTASLTEWKHDSQAPDSAKFRKPDLDNMAVFNITQLLWHACRAGDLDLLEDTVKRGGNINWPNSDCVNWSPLAVAIMESRGIVVQELLRKGACLEVLDDDKLTPLGLAVKSASSRTVCDLLQHGANVAAVQGPSGCSALHLAILRGDPEIIRILIDQRANVNQQDVLNGMSPMHYVAQLPDTHALQSGLILLEGSVHQAGADVLLKTLQGDSAIDLAVIGNKHDVIALLSAAGANPRDELVQKSGLEEKHAAGGVADAVVFEISSRPEVSVEHKRAAARARMKSKLANKQSRMDLAQECVDLALDLGQLPEEMAELRLIKNTEQRAAATKIQAVQRGNQSRKKPWQKDKKDAEQSAAATKIQAVQRGKNSRKAGGKGGKAGKGGAWKDAECK